MTDANQSDAVVVPEQDAALMAAAEEALKPCPFCEGVARVVEDSDRKYPWAVRSFHQADCFLMHSNINRHRSYETEAEAIAAWNTRAEQAKPSGERQEGSMVLIEVERNAEGEVMICTGCGTVETVRSIRARTATAFTCCPERKMVRAADFGDHGAEQPKPSASCEAGEVERVLGELRQRDADWQAKCDGWMTDLRTDGGEVNPATETAMRRTVYKDAADIINALRANATEAQAGERS